MLQVCVSLVPPSALSEFNDVPSFSSSANPASSQFPSVLSHPLSCMEESSPSDIPHFEDHPLTLDHGIRRLSMDSHSSFSFINKRVDASTDLVNDDMSFMMNLDENSFLDHSKIGHESSRVHVPNWENDSTPQRVRVEKAASHSSSKFLGIIV